MLCNLKETGNSSGPEGYNVCGSRPGERIGRAARGAAGWWRRLGRRGRLKVAAWTLGGLAAAGDLTVFAWTRELPAFDTLKDYRPLVSTRVYGVDGSEVFAFARERRTVVPFEQIPQVMKKAVLAAEDAKFYEHEGVDYLAIGRCMAKGLLRGGLACGGSTITQQVVKTFLLQSDWKVKRKVKELVLAPRLEKNLAKDEILYLYLNQIYLGHRRYSVEEASRFYFGKSVRDLALGEAAMLAGLVQSPERLSPAKHPDAAKARQKYVLRRMVIRRLLSIVFAFSGFLAGCGGSNWVHPNKPSSEFTNEYNRCQNLVLRDPKLQQGSQLLILNATERCLQREGWRLVESE